MFTEILFQVKNWFFGEVIDETKEFELLESKHARVHYDENLSEIIRVH